MNTARHIQDDTRKAVRTLWSWLRRATPAAELTPSMDGCEVVDDQRAAIEAAPAGGIILPFPVRGDALLVKLAEVLRRRIAVPGTSGDGRLPVLSHEPELRLWIDDDAHVVFDARRSEFDLTIETPGGARMIIQTADFDVLVTYVVQYVADRLSGDHAVEVAS
jgi:hypothetical protein